MTTYVVGLDRSTPVSASLGWARGVATPDDAIVAAHVLVEPVNPIYEGVVAIPDPSIEEGAEAWLDRVIADQDDRRVSGRLLTGHAGMALVDVAVEAGPDVIVVVGHGGSSKASLLLGSTAHYLTHHAEAPVVVVRGTSRVPVRRVVVGVDGDGDEPDDRSLAALRWAVRIPGVERVEATHADFVPGVAAGPIREPGLESDDAVGEDRTLLQTAIDRATDGSGLAPSGAGLVPVVAAGTGAFAMIEASRDADLVVVGSHGRRAVMELILGSTSLEVLAHAHCPVAVVR